MTKDPSEAGRFVISARQGEQTFRQTRATVASAIVLARNWREAGLLDVTVIDPSGSKLTPEDYAANEWAKIRDR